MIYSANGYELPAGWRWAKLQDIGDFDSGSTPSKSVESYWNGHIPFVTGADITQFYITSANARAFLTDEGLASGKTAICESGTVLFVTRTRVGRIGIAAELMAASQDLSPYHCGANVIPEFVCWYLLSISDYLLANCRGSTILGLTRDFIHSIEFPLPPLDEQRRIAAILDEQMAAVEQARAAAEAQLEAAQGLMAAYLRQVFESEEAQEWPVVPLGEVGNVCSGITKGRKQEQGAEYSPTPYLSVANVKDGYLDLTEVKEIPASLEEQDKYHLEWGDLLLTEGGDPDKLGRGTFWQEEIPGCIHQNHIFRVRFSLDSFVPRFLSAQIGSSYGKAYFFAHAKQTTGIATINQAVLKGFPLMVPAYEAQERIAAEIEEIAEQIDRACASSQEQLDLVSTLPASLLRRAFSGEL